MPVDYFSSDYATARARFCEAAAQAGARLEILPLAARGPNDERLGIDAAWLGDARPRRVLVHASGLHGLEGFAGSAIQLRLLANLPPVPSDAALVFLHVVNPYGMAWRRRFNESNVDLNRNFLAPEEAFCGVAEAYRQLNGLLNPSTPPHRADGFLLRAAWSVARFGFQNLKQAIAEGQYEFPQGLFFGGQRGEETATVLTRWSRERLTEVERLFVVDVHTGLGRWGHDALLTHYRADSETAQRLRHALGERVEAWQPAGVAYQIRGGFLEALERGREGSTTAVCQEFGTYAPLRVLHALREENRLHHWGDARDFDHPAKRRAVEAFCPRNAGWRERVLRRGEQLVAEVVERLL